MWFFSPEWCMCRLSCSCWFMATFGLGWKLPVEILCRGIRGGLAEGLSMVLSLPVPLPAALPGSPTEALVFCGGGL